MKAKDKKMFAKDDKFQENEFKKLEKIMYEVARKKGLSTLDAKKVSKITPKRKKQFNKDLQKVKAKYK